MDTKRKHGILYNPYESPWGSAKESILVALATVLVVGMVVIPALVSTAIPSVATSRTILEGQGYVVLSAGEYLSISAKLDAIKVSADNATAQAQTAVVAAQNAVTTAQTAANKVDLFNTADTFSFPATTDHYCLLTADATADNWTAWREIKDNVATSLSSAFVGKAGYISDVYIYQLTAPADTTFIVEIAYGADQSHSLTRIMFNSDHMHLSQIKSRRIPADSTIYYRMMMTSPPIEYIDVGFRYFYE